MKRSPSRSVLWRERRFKLQVSFRVGLAAGGSRRSNLSKLFSNSNNKRLCSPSVRSSECSICSSKRCTTRVKSLNSRTNVFEFRVIILEIVSQFDDGLGDIPNFQERGHQAASSFEIIVRVSFLS